MKYQTIGNYRGVDIFVTHKDGKIIFIAALDKFYSSLQVESLYDLIDGWWQTRRN